MVAVKICNLLTVAQVSLEINDRMFGNPVHTFCQLVYVNSCDQEVVV